MEELGGAVIHRSLHRPNLFFGAEREPILAAALLPVAFGLSAFSLPMFLTGLFFWIVSSFFLRAMAKRDHILTKIWLRSIRYQAFYPARTSIWRRDANKMK